MLPTKFRFIWQSGFRVEDIKKSTNQRQELPVVAMFVSGLKKSSLKPLGQMNRNLVGSILGRTSIKFAHLVPIH
jgi:hypothetical protein